LWLDACPELQKYADWIRRRHDGNWVSQLHKGFFCAPSVSDIRGSHTTRKPEQTSFREDRQTAASSTTFRVAITSTLSQVRPVTSPFGAVGQRAQQRLHLSSQARPLASTKMMTTRHSSSPKLVWPVLGLILAAWAVALGGLASLQANCSADSYMGVRGFNAGVIGCNKIYRYYWCGTAI
jgi:hypothetical protein